MPTWNWDYERETAEEARKERRQRRRWRTSRSFPSPSLPIGSGWVDVAAATDWRKFVGWRSLERWERVESSEGVVCQMCGEVRLNRVWQWPWLPRHQGLTTLDADEDALLCFRIRIMGIISWHRHTRLSRISL